MNKNDYVKFADISCRQKLERLRLCFSSVCSSVCLLCTLLQRGRDNNVVICYLLFLNKISSVSYHDIYQIISSSSSVLHYHHSLLLSLIMLRLCRHYRYSHHIFAWERLKAKLGNSGKAKLAARVLLLS